MGKKKPAKARKKMLGKWTQLHAAGNRVFKSKDEAKGKLDEPSAAEATSIRSAMRADGETLSGKLAYDTGYFNVKDIARRLSLLEIA